LNRRNWKARLRILNDDPLQGSVSKPPIGHWHLRRACAINLVLFTIKYCDSRKIKHLQNAKCHLTGRWRLLIQQKQIAAEFVQPFHFLLTLHGFHGSTPRSGGQFASGYRRHQKREQSHPVLLIGYC
jgi:hypothetical protein